MLSFSSIVFVSVVVFFTSFHDMAKGAGGDCMSKYLINIWTFDMLYKVMLSNIIVLSTICSIFQIQEQLIVLNAIRWKINGVMILSIIPSTNMKCLQPNLVKGVASKWFNSLEPVIYLFKELSKNLNFLSYPLRP